MLEKLKQMGAKPVSVLALLAFLAVATTLFAGWGLWRMTDLSAEYKTRDDHMLALAVNIKEKVASFSKLTYDFLLQQDFNRMLMKEKQSDATREEITRNLGALTLQSEGANAETIEAIRYNVMQFLTLTDKALETAVEQGSSGTARAILQDEVEPALKKAQDSLTTLVQSRQKYGANHIQFLRQQAIIFIALLVGLTALGMAMLAMLRIHLAAPAKKEEVAKPEAAALPAPVVEEKPAERVIEASSLSTLAFMNRFNRLHKESDELKKLVTSMQRILDLRAAANLQATPEEELKALNQQSEKISLTVGRIQNINDQSKQFIERLNELMGGMQNLATEGNIVALNVTIELAKLQSQISGGPHDEKNIKVSEQIRALATSAANITGKMAMVLSQFRYAQDDFGKHTTELLQIKNTGASALEQIRRSLQNSAHNTSALMGERMEFENYLPMINQKMGDLSQEIEQLQLFANEEMESHRSEGPERAFKVISGRVA